MIIVDRWTGRVEPPFPGAPTRHCRKRAGLNGGLGLGCRDGWDHANGCDDANGGMRCLTMKMLLGMRLQGWRLDGLLQRSEAAHGNGRGLKLPKQKVHPLVLAKTISQRHSHIDLLLEANST